MYPVLFSKTSLFFVNYSKNHLFKLSNSTFFGTLY